ncbi:MAG: PIG-L family deacetylase [Alphaproteobacteria bacterium]|nr:PIG-L family deacetylase [Alphaproteobacteria bacterium]
MGEVVLAVAAHPDDEMLGCAGTLARHVACGDVVHLVFLAEGGDGARLDKNDLQGHANSQASIVTAARNAASCLGSQPPQFLGFPDNRMDGLPLLDIVKDLEKVIDSINPTIIYTHHAHDLNVDHRVTHQAVLTACRPLPGSAIKAIFAYEVLSSTEWASPNPAFAFTPTRYVDISTFLAQKIILLACYETEMRPFPHARSNEAVEALARLRGSEVGFFAAEAFMVLRECVR